MPIINLTQHAATPDQIADGVVDITNDRLRQKVQELLTFDSLPSMADVYERARELTAIALAIAVNHDADHVMIGGAPYLMAALDAELTAEELIPVYAFSRRESVEQTQPDGSVRKVAVFRHAGFVRP